MDNFGAELRALDNRIMRQLEQRFRELDRDMVTGTNGWILSYLIQNADRDVYQRELESEFGITRSTVSKVAKLMEQKGLIERVTDSRDARQLMLRLTEHAKAIAREMEAECGRLNDKLLRGFDTEEIAKLHEYMGRMLLNMCEEDD